jgi:large subunit ribosomal protein L3
MPRGLIGKKVGMTQIFDEAGRAVPVTVIEAGPCVVVQKKTPERDGYAAVQLGFGAAKRVNKPMAGHFEAAKVRQPRRKLAEFATSEDFDPEPAEEVSVGIFDTGESLRVSGVSKGKGFAGAMKRHGFHGGKASHGSKVHRAPQSSGATDAARTFKGTRKPGRMGGANVTVRNVTVVRVDAARNLLLVKGPVPGANGGYLRIQAQKVKQ